ncbi:hypothetical protein ACVJGD_000102 [Bradyrhizobium sp. USDA 10063]
MIRSQSWPTGAPIETVLELWASSLRDVKRRIRPLFAQERTAASAGTFIDGLLSEERRKTGGMRAEAAGDPGPRRQQELLGRDRWDADELRDLVRDYVVEHLGDEGAVLVIDEIGFLKQGKASCGVARQYTGSAGKITNCQIGVLCVASRPCLHGPRALSAEKLDGGSASPESRSCAGGIRSQYPVITTNYLTKTSRQSTLISHLPSLSEGLRQATAKQSIEPQQHRLP